jgi:Cu-Zn family superoxide dismutase
VSQRCSGAAPIAGGTTTIEDPMKRMLLILVCATLASAGCARVQKIVTKTPGATATLLPTRGHEARGMLRFAQSTEMVVITGTIGGLSPGLHALHIHDKGNCTAPDASSAGGHFNPHGAPHGGPYDAGHHAGDLGNITAGEDGVAEVSIEADRLSLGTEKHSIIGRSVIVHAGPDDYKSQPSGNAGGRVACGLISKDP